MRASVEDEPQHASSDVLIRIATVRKRHPWSSGNPVGSLPPQSRYSGFQKDCVLHAPCAIQDHSPVVRVQGP